MLNIKQEKFIQNIIKGMSQRQAYKDAYNANYSDKAIDEKASTLFNSEKVQKRYKELLNKLEEESIMSAKKRMTWLTKVINDEILEDIAVMTDTTEDKAKTIKCPTKIDTKLKALDILNKMSAEYITKVEADLDFNIRVELDD